MKWKTSYAIGVEIIDEQHKKLFDLAEQAEILLELPNYIDKYDEIMNIISDLKDYVIYHFEEEEKLLLKIQYNKFFSHKVRHQDFVERINEIDLNDIDKDQPNELRKVTNLIITWLLDHVLSEDKQWAEFYKNKR